MKKTLLAIGMASLISSSLNADFLKLELGVGGWQETPSGTINYEDDTGVTGTYTSNESDSTNMYAWMLLKHPIPIVPNVRLEYAKITDDGKSDGTFENFTTPGDSPTTIDITEYDIIPYYNILDNTFWMTLDLGLDLRVQTTKLEAKGVELLGVASPFSYTATYTDEETIVLPLLYGRLRVEIPATDIGLETDLKYITYQDSTIYDFRAKVDYTLDFIPVLQPAFELGYRIQKFDIYDDSDGTTTSDLTFSGVYGGLMLRF